MLIKPKNLKSKQAGNNTDLNEKLFWKLHVLSRREVKREDYSSEYHNAHLVKFHIKNLQQTYLPSNWLESVTY